PFAYSERQMALLLSPIRLGWRRGLALASLYSPGGGGKRLAFAGYQTESDQSFDIDLAHIGRVSHTGSDPAKRGFLVRTKMCPKAAQALPPPGRGAAPRPHTGGGPPVLRAVVGGGLAATSDGERRPSRITRTFYLAAMCTRRRNCALPD